MVAISRTTQSRDVFKIVVGDGWRTAAPVKPGTVSAHPQRIDLGRVRDVVDIVVHGTSICGRTDEDSIFFLVRDFLSAVEKLLKGDGTARVSFYEGPFELVMQRLSSRVYITFYRVGRRPQVVVKDQLVSINSLAGGVVSSAKHLSEQAVNLDPEAEKDPLFVEIGESLKRIQKRLSKSRPADNAKSPAIKLVKSTRWAEPRSEKSFSFGFQFKAGPTDLLSREKPRGSDLNSLLFKGQHVVHARGRRVVLGEGFLFLQTERLLASLGQLFNAWEEGRPMSIRLISEGLVVGVRLGRDDELVVSLMDSGRDDTIIVLNDLTPWEYADAVLGLARELRRLVVDTNPEQRRNLRLEAFSREVKSLANWTKEHRSGAVINKDVDRYRRLAKPHKAAGSPSMIGETSRLRFQEQWRVEVESPDLSGTQLCGGMVLVSARGAVLGIDARSGAVAWRREADRCDAVTQVTGSDSFVRAMSSGQIELIDLFSGVLRWRTELSPRSGGSPVALVVEHGPQPGLIIAAEEDRKIVALDIRSGEPRWRFTTSRGGRFGLRRYGQLLYISSNDSHFNAVDVDDGSLVWRFADRTRFSTPAAINADMVLAVGGRPGRPEGKMYALDAFSGELKWTVNLDGGAVTSPIVTDDVALVPIRVGRRCDLVGIDALSGKILWRIDCTGWADPSALMALDDRFIINSAGGVLRSINARDGEEKWVTALGPTFSEDVPASLKVVLRGGMLFAPGDTVYMVRPEDGHIIHTLEGDPPVPDLLQVDPSCSVFVAEDSGHMAMYSLTGRLSVVP